MVVGIGTHQILTPIPIPIYLHLPVQTFTNDIADTGLSSPRGQQQLPPEEGNKKLPVEYSGHHVGVAASTCGELGRVELPMFCTWHVHICTWDNQ